jgi:hypothetical protein
VIAEALDLVKADWTERNPSWTSADRDLHDLPQSRFGSASSTRKASGSNMRHAETRLLRDGIRTISFVGWSGPRLAASSLRCA